MRWITARRRLLFMRPAMEHSNGMSLLELVFAFSVFVLFSAVMAAISEQIQAYLGADRALPIQLPPPDQLSWKLADRLHWLSQILDQPAIANKDTLKQLAQQCRANPLTQIPSGMIARPSFPSGNDDMDSKVQLESLYEICLHGPYPQQGPQGQQLFVLVAKPNSNYRVSPSLPVVRHVFCRPRPLCG